MADRSERMKVQNRLLWNRKASFGRSTRFAFSLAIIGIIWFLTMIQNVTIPINQESILWDIALALAFVPLVAIETDERKRSPDGVTFGGRVGYLLLRIIFVEVIQFLDGSTASLFLATIVPFSAVFSLGLLPGILLTAGYLYIYATTLGVSFNPPPVDFITLAYAMSFATVMGYLLKRNEHYQRYTEHLLNDLQLSNMALQAYAEQVVELAAAEERNRMARDIHDSLGHYLTAISIQLEKALVYRDRDMDEAMQAVKDARQAASEALQDVRESVSALRNSENQFSFKESLTNLLRALDQEQYDTQITIKGEETRYSQSVLMTLYRAAQEGITNILKHADAHHISLSVTFGEENAYLCLTDDGKGFDPQKARAQDRSFGLRGIKERVELLQGKLDIQSSPKGSTITATIPRVTHP